jgi:osmotically-inducible protein OsmY
MKTDLEIQKNVMEELKWEPFLTASEIGVAVKNGIVILSGIVDRFSKKVAAEKAAQRVLGVKAVAVEIDVRVSAMGKRDDSEIAAAVINALKWNSSILEDKIKVKVEDGLVTLDGEVEWDFQKNAAKKAIENLWGVVGIVNNIKVTPTVKSSDIKDKIKSAFLRSATVDSERINIEVEGNKVILLGKVSSYSEKIDAENAAWLAPGINKVENKLEVFSPVNESVLSDIQ